MADAAAQALLEVMQDNCKDWDASSWRASYERAVSYLFELPTPSDESAPASETAAVSQHLHPLLQACLQAPWTAVMGSL